MKRLAFVSLLFIGAFIVLFGSAGTSSVAATQDFCGTAEVDVPDTGDAFDFTGACMHHDECYAVGGGPLERLRCDQRFLAEMNTWCTTHWQRGDAHLLRCKLVAATYYAGVRLGGWVYFYTS